MFSVATGCSDGASDQPGDGRTSKVPSSGESKEPSGESSSPIKPVGSATSKPTNPSPGEPKPADSAEVHHDPLKVLAFVVTSDVKNRDPVDELKVAQAGQKAWGHITVRNRSKEERRLTMYFYVDGDQRSMVDLKVKPSQSYRTYAFNTIKPSDKDKTFRVEVRDDTGTLLQEAKIPIKTKAVTAPYTGAK